jgi:chitinase
MEHEASHLTFEGLLGAALVGVLVGCGGGGGGSSRSPPLVAPAPSPSILIQPIAVTESNETGVEALFPVTLTHAPDSPVTVDWHTVDATALAGEDYEPARGRLVFGTDVLEDEIRIEVLGDVLDEPDEEFALVLERPVGASLETDRAMVKIEDDDDAPRLSIEGGKTSEGTGLVTFQVHLSDPSRRTVRVHFETRSGSALEGRDFEGISGTLIFHPGVKLQGISVRVTNDRDTEGDEDFFVVLSSPEHAGIAVDRAAAVIDSSDQGVVPEEPEPRGNDGNGVDEPGKDKPEKPKKPKKPKKPGKDD